MPTPHVFIVHDQSFPIHLEYLFAGTTPGRKNISKHVGLLSDIARVRPGDPVMFYCMERGFYGIFCISRKDPLIIWDPDPQTYLENELGEHLIYRVFIEPEKVYPKPVTEWEAIDNLPLYAKDIRWSLIYRKLKAERGCAPIFPQDFNGLIKLLDETNEGNCLEISPGEGLTFDTNAGEIKKSGQPPKAYQNPIQRPINPLNEASSKIQKNKPFEGYLQAYFTLNVDRAPTLAPVCGASPQLDYFANEVYAGMGMQKIDIFTILCMNKELEFRIVELKSVPASPEDVNQLAKYVRWTKVYMPGATSKTIQPVLVSRSGLDKAELAKVSSAITAYNNGREAKPIKFFEFNVDITSYELLIQQSI